MWKKWLRENHPEHYQEMQSSLKHDVDWRDREIARLKGEVERVTNHGMAFAFEVEQVLAQVIGGFPWFKDDQKSFPGSTEKDGVCIGELVVDDLVHHAAKLILRAKTSDWYEAVLDFHKKFGQLIGKTPQIPSDKVRTLRVNLIDEEKKELELALLSNDMPEIADACADLIYVIVGTAISYGIDLRTVFNEVQRTNMAKENGGTRGDGKVMKPKDWKAPDIEGVLVKQGWVKPPEVA